MMKVIKKVIFFSALILLLYLGSWQVQRYVYKLTVISQIKANKDNAPIDISSISELKKATYKNVKLNGKFINEKPIYYYALKNNTPGYEIILPFELESSKEYALINTGWSPSKLPQKSYKKNIEITGFIIQLPRKYLINFQNDVEKNLWFDLSPHDLSKYLGKEVAPSMILLETKQYLIGEPVNFDVNQVRSSHHLGYALVWFSLAISLVVIYKIKKRNKFLF